MLIECCGVKVGAFVCFDSVFPSLAPVDSELLLVCTNDSWFEDTPGIYQHLAHSAVRAVENGKWLIRAANTGVSCFVSPKGAASENTEPLTQAVIYGTVYPNARRTLYSYVGDVIMILPLAFALSIAVCKAASLIKKHKKVRNAQ